MTGLVDEIMTPGCPQCAVKHLCAALARTATGPLAPVPPDHFVDAARAYVNVVEAREGYVSHREFAVGLLVAAEESAVSAGADADALALRTARLALLSGDDASALHDLFATAGGQLDRAHFAEALRELPALAEEFGSSYPPRTQEGADRIRQMVEWIRKEYFAETGCGKEEA